jgi:hypothetical protein
MKKSTLAVAALLTALSTAPVMSVAYADDTAPAAAATCKGCAGCKGCKGCSGCKGCKGE